MIELGLDPVPPGRPGMHDEYGWRGPLEGVAAAGSLGPASCARNRADSEMAPKVDTKWYVGLRRVRRGREERMPIAASVARGGSNAAHGVQYVQEGSAAVRPTEALPV